jgi:hypothetical protein
MITRRSRFLPCASSRLGAPPQGVRACSSPGRASLDPFALRLWLGSFALGLLLTAGPAQAQPYTYVVNSTGEAGAVNPKNDGICDSQNGPGVTCTLRAAIEEGNNTPSTLDTITFAILPAGAKTINLGATLTISDPVIIDGTTQTGSVGGIELNFAALPGTDPGIVINNAVGGSTIRGLVINRCPGNAIRIFGSSGNTVAGNYIGTDVNGTTCNASLGNFVGIRIEGTASNPSNGNVIGGGLPGDRNIISGSKNLTDGIQMQGQTGGTSGNTIRGNYIGTDVNGTGTTCGNTRDGIELLGPGTVANNVIAGNVISGNGSFGIKLDGAGTTGTLIQGNKIGTNAAGTAGIPNTIGIRFRDRPRATATRSSTMRSI